MAFGNNKLFGKFKKPILIIYIVLILLAVVVLFKGGFSEDKLGAMPGEVWLIGAVLLLGAVILSLMKIVQIFRILQSTGSKLDELSEMLGHDRSILNRVDQHTQLSDSAKTIIFGGTDRRTLREAIFERLQQQDFDGTYELINEIGRMPRYKILAEELRVDADNYRDATDQERVNQVIAHIEKLFESYQWAKSSILIERLIKAEPNSDKAHAMRQRLVDRKEERKKILLTAWDDAVKRQATDRSLEILRELDLYLTPNEALALQEAARDVFRNKLHSLGVRFSLAVSGKKWGTALETAQEIIRDFPNSRMAEEIRERIEALRQKVEQQGGV